MFSKSAIAIAMTATISTAALADSVLFPYFSSSDNVTTIVSLVNTGSTDKLHYQLFYKYGEAAAESDSTCEEFDLWLPTSQNDIQTFDLGGKYGQETYGVLFNDPSFNNNYMKNGQSFSMARGVSPTRGFLLVDSKVDSDSGSLTGEAIALDFSTGASWGYQAISNSGHLENNFTAAASAPSIAMMMPTSEFATAFMVTPTSVDQSTGEAATTIGFANNTVYDRDENPISGTRYEPVTCVGRVEASSLMSSATANAIADGGWGVVETAGGTGAVVIKLEYNTSNTVNGEAVDGTFNNAVMFPPAKPVFTQPVLN